MIGYPTEIYSRTAQVLLTLQKRGFPAMKHASCEPFRVLDDSMCLHRHAMDLNSQQTAFTVAVMFCVSAEKATLEFTTEAQC